MSDFAYLRPLAIVTWLLLTWAYCYGIWNAPVSIERPSWGFSCAERSVGRYDYEPLLDSMERDACDLQKQTGLPMAVVEGYQVELKAAIDRGQFNAKQFLDSLKHLDGIALENARNYQHAAAIEAALPLLILPPLAWFGIQKTRPLLRRQIVLARDRAPKLATYAAIVLDFLCFWTAAAEEPLEMFARGQWRLLGWVLLLTAAGIRWRHHVR